MYQRLPLFVMPRSFNSLHISLSPLPRRDFSNISFTTGAVAGSTSSVGRSFALSRTLIFLYPKGALEPRKKPRDAASLIPRTTSCARFSE